jgi:hypothetical protein
MPPGPAEQVYFIAGPALAFGAPGQREREGEVEAKEQHFKIEAEADAEG